MSEVDTTKDATEEVIDDGTWFDTQFLVPSQPYLCRVRVVEKGKPISIIKAYYCDSYTSHWYSENGEELEGSVVSFQIITE